MYDILNVRGAMNCATTNAFLIMIDHHSEMVLGNAHEVFGGYKTRLFYCKN